MRLLIIFISFMAFLPASNAATLGPGDIYTFGFDTLFPYLEPADSTPIVKATSVAFRQPFIQPDNYIVSVRLFEDNNPTSTPFYEAIFTNPHFPLAIFDGIFPANTWADLSGLIEVETIEGSLVLDSVYVSAVSDGELYTSERTQITEPQTITLLFLALGILSVASSLKCNKDQIPS